MVFKRRDKPPILSRLRQAVLPKRGFRRGIEYLTHRVRRLPDSPHRIALGFAIGTWVSFTPLFGLHLLIAIGGARLVGGNILASVMGTFVGNPLTTPLIASLSLTLGREILGHGASGHDFRRIADAFSQFADGLWQMLLSLFGAGMVDWSKLTLLYRDIFLPYLVGGFLPGVIAAIASYYLCRPLVAAYQAARRARFQVRAERRATEAAGQAAAVAEAEAAARKEAGAGRAPAYSPADTASGGDAP